MKFLKIFIIFNWVIKRQVLMDNFILCSMSHCINAIIFLSRRKVVTINCVSYENNFVNFKKSLVLYNHEF